MERRHLKESFASIKSLCTIFALTGLSAGGYWVLHKPVAFRQLVSVIPAPAGSLPKLKDEPGIDAKSLIASIPYKDQRDYTVKPEDRYRKAILEGYGNCSNLSFGLVYKLVQIQHDFRLVFFMPLPVSENASQGHTVVQARIDVAGQTYKGILDLNERGILMREGRPVKLKQIRQEGFQHVVVNHMVPYEPPQGSFYATHGNVVVGMMLAPDVQRYYAFLSSIYFPLGNGKLEKYLFEGAALVLGVYPDIHVRTDQFSALLREDGGMRRFALATLWYFRLLPLFTLTLAFRAWRARRERQPPQAAMLEMRKSMAA